MSALVIGASGTIGRAMTSALHARYGSQGVQTLSRSVDGFDVLDETCMAVTAGRLSGPFETIFLATGALEIDGHAPEKSLGQITPAGMAQQFSLNAIGPALVLKHFSRHLPKQGRSIFAVLSARVGSIGDNRLGGWHSYRASKAALNQVVRGAAIELGRTRPDAICVALHPGTVQGPLTQKYLGRHPAVSADVAAGHLLRVMDGLDPDDTGGFLDWRGEKVAW